MYPAITIRIYGVEKDRAPMILYVLGYRMLQPWQSRDIVPPRPAWMSLLLKVSIVLGIQETGVPAVPAFRAREPLKNMKARQVH